MRLSLESRLLLLLCLCDLFYTVTLIVTGSATEANPLLRPCLLWGGLAVLIVAKLLLSVAPLLALERLRRKRPRFISALLRAGIGLYLLSFFCGTWLVNAAP